MKPILIALCALLLTYNSMSVASTSINLEGTIKGGQFAWKSAASLSSNYYTTANAAFYSTQLGSTEQWIPGGLAGANTNNIVVTNGDGDSVTIPVKLSGIQYYALSTTEDIKQTIATPSCSNSSYSEPHIDVIGASCYHANFIKNSNWSAPFSVVRPILQVDGDIAAAFSDQPSGTYAASIPVPFSYQWLYQSSQWTQTVLTPTISLTINHVPDEIVSISVSPNDEIIAQYNQDNTVSGNTRYAVTVNGTFQKGINLSLLNRGRDFALTLDGAGDLTNGSIPYSVECLACDDNSGYTFVNKGSAVTTPSTTTQLSVSSVTNVISFDVDVSFEGVDLEGLQYGRYADTFILQFEPEI